MNHITIHVKRGGLGLWSTLLQKGVEVQALVGISVASFLEEQLGLDSAYVENVVRTIFVNGSPVDDIDTVPVRDGDVLALAGAMPGLVGIAMGRQSLVGGFREDISCRGGGVLDKGEVGLVTVKAFNVVARTVGEAMLGHGVVVPVDYLAAYLADRSALLADAVVSVRMNDEVIFSGEISRLLQRHDGLILLRVLVQ
ncbi:hypothetical protein [Salidesulfovibrio onnuriiensis]|uniref:hypothetical protein n=1 Tax=Salidesulfovibrio onnuriiensis TaxID=2583823 RepID=UPI0011C8334F|nr:hypothetical protein [Salidesulfovibrio onnuriiensis]